MKQQVDRVLANALLDEGEVYLPTVGTLILRRNAAKLLSKKQLQSPYRELLLTKEQRGKELAIYIAQTANVSTERASDIYAEWLEQSLRNDILTIEGVCCIERGNITTHQTFEDMANPNGRGTVRVNPRTNYLIYIMAALCMGFALSVAGYVLYTNGAIQKLISICFIAPASQAFEGIPDATTEEEEVVEIVKVTEVAEATQPAEPATTVVTEPIVDEVTTPTNPSILPLQKGKSYAVWGVYNELQNAEKAVNWLSTRIPEIKGVNIYDYNGRYMVALCEVASRSECGRKVSAWKSEHVSCKSVWVYTK